MFDVALRSKYKILDKKVLVHCPHFLLKCSSLSTAARDNFNIDHEHDTMDNEDNEENNAANFDEDELIKYYFQWGFKYEEIFQFHDKYYNHGRSYSTLLRRLKQYGLKRRDQLTNDIFIRARARISDIINGPGSAGGYCTVWHTLEVEGIQIYRTRSPKYAMWIRSRRREY